MCSRSVDSYWIVSLYPCQLVLIACQIDTAKTGVAYAIYAAENAGIIKICINLHIVLPYK